jgi:hypothetical protein
MRRIIAAFGAGAISVALLLGTLQASAAAPYVYACSQVAIAANVLGNARATRVTIYNGTATSANITMKALALDGTILNSALGITTSFSVPPTTTRWTTWQDGGTHDPGTDNANPSTVRIVSDQPVETFTNATIGTENNIFPCILQAQS